MYLYYTPWNREISFQQQARCHSKICSMYCGACSSTCMIPPSRSTQLFFPPAERGWWRGNEISSFQLFCTQPVKAKCQKQMICGTTLLSFLPQKNRQDLWTSWKINEEKGRRLRCNPVNEMKSIQDETCGTQNNHSLLIVVCCLGKRTERNSFYYPVTYLSPGKDRDPSLIDFITSETTQLLPWRVHSTSLRDTSLPLHGLHMIESEEKLHAAQSCSLLHKY